MLSRRWSQLTGLVLLAGVAACSSHGESTVQAPREHEITLTPTYDSYIWGMTVGFVSDINYQPGEPYVKYEYSAALGTVICSSDHGEQRQVIPHPGEYGAEMATPPSLLPYARQLNYQIFQLPVGKWSCTETMSINLLDRDNKKYPRTLHSNVALVNVAKPGPADEAVIKESGLWKAYQENTLKSYASISLGFINAHPDSHYYCRDWVEELHRWFDGSKKTWAHMPITTTPLDETATWGTKPSKYTEPLENLEKYKCTEASSADYAFWHADNSLAFLSDFNAAQAYARKGLTLNPDPDQKAYFEKLLRFQSEADYLRQFKHIKRLGADGLWRESP